MADRLSWWVIPGALVVLARVLTLAAGEPVSERAVAATAAGAVDQVVVRDAAGQRSLPFPLSALTETAFVVTVPKALVGQRGTMTLWRRLAGGREPKAWLTFQAKVRADATIPIAGLAKGRYDVELALACGTTTKSFVVNNATCPGELVLVEAAPAR